jgi:hypothetical protein
MADKEPPDRIPIFNFMTVRAPEAIEEQVLQRHYVRDDILFTNNGRMTRVAADLHSTESTSCVGKAVYKKVFCDPPPHSKPWEKEEALLDLLQELLRPLTARVPACGDGDPCPADPKVGPLLLEELDGHAYIKHAGRCGGYYYILPDRLEQIAGVPFIPLLIQALPILVSYRAKLDRKQLVRRLEALFNHQYLHRVVFDKHGHSADFINAKRAVFDTLYLLYVVRRWTSINLEHIIAGLCGLHALEALAVDRLCDRARTGAIDSSEQALLTSLAGVFPQLHGWDFKAAVPGLPLIGDETDLEAYLSATPIIHKIFARLFWYAEPFNDIKPIGVGDLKVVKQWLLGYKVGEIAHIDNVLQSEMKSRVHRHLEKTEEVFSFTSEQQEETSQDTQTTDRFEVKREAEQIVKSDLSVNAGLNVNLTYAPTTGYTIVSSVTGGFAYSRSQTDQSKAVNNYARDVVDKAVRRVQNRVSTQRTTTTLFETEETNTHTFDNKQGTKHISGLYHWLDKVYRSRIYNFGKRMMFEFILPEPAAFLVESRLRAYEASLEVPQPPEPPKQWAELPKWVEELGLDPETKAEKKITEEEFRKYSKIYDLTEFTFPSLNRRVSFVDSKTGNNYFSERWVDASTWQGRTFTCRLNAKDYRIIKLTIEGYVFFWGTHETKYPSDINTFELYVDGQRYFREANNAAERWYFGGNYGTDYAVANALPFADDQVSLFLGFWDGSQFDLSLHAELELSPSVLKDWQTRVYAKIRAIEQKKVDAQNNDIRQTYQSRLATYKNRLDELRATAINDLLQGQSEAFNRQIILRELKRQCIARITKEFDADPSDDVLTDLEAMGSRDVLFKYYRLKVKELPDSSNPTKALAGFELEDKQVSFPVPDLPPARLKGRYIQFLEQAFEWQQLAYLCYPYFWATPPRWVELMNRNDAADPFFSAFLQAGSVRVLLAVSPAYEDAVLHYVATGEPWEGGPAPVIGDPLYVPLYEELREQQDDLANAVPEGEAWTFTLPTSLVYLQNSSTPLPPLNNAD